MTTAERIAGITKLSDELKDLDLVTKTELFSRASATNPWFTHDSIAMALDGILHFLNSESLSEWVGRYQVAGDAKNVGLVLAGNIPLVGFHDFLSVLLSGNNAQIKLSSQDSVLLKYISERLIDINPDFENQINYVDRLNDADAVIATGSDNSSRYFKKYFKDIPHIIRKNRTSVAVLNGEETDSDLKLLGTDIFSYFGLGCRNVAKVYIPAGFDMTKLLDALGGREDVKNHPKYFNNYEYNKAIYLVNRVVHLDTGYALFRESDDIVSPLSVIYYEEYKDLSSLKDKLNSHIDKLQCIVSNSGIDNMITVPLGRSQFPNIDDYADNVDTMKFLCSLN
jgi:hypothetical protein